MDQMKIIFGAAVHWARSEGMPVIIIQANNAGEKLHLDRYS